MEKNKFFLLFNGISLYIYWWTTFWGVANNKFLIGPILAIIYFIVHFFIIKNKLKEFKYMLFCLVFGFTLESSLYFSGLMTYKGMFTNKFLPVPFWILILWIGYSLTVFHSFKWIYKRYFVSFIMGGLIAPLMYVSANKIKIINFNYDVMETYFILMPLWSLSFLILNYASVKINENL